MSILSILIRMAIAAVFYFAPDLFLHSGIKKAFVKRTKAIRKYWILNISIFILAFGGMILSRYISSELVHFNLYLLGLFVAFLFAKIVAGIILLGEDLVRIPFSLITRKKRKTENPDAKTLVSRRKFISQSAILLSFIPFGGFIYGMIKGKYNFTVHKQTVYFDDLPAAFDGITITQISDLHIGSWDHAAKHKLEYLVELIRSLNSDLLFFTGDIVNSRADEMDGWIETFRKLSAPLGVYSILGNHDYGDYASWNSEEDKADNLRKVKAIHPQLGFHLLLNEYAVIEKNNEKIFIVGVENWGKGGFQKFGDIQKATEGLAEQDFKILLSHDPSHWDAVVLKEASPPQLTLSGHTHGFQMGIETPLFRFSPSQWVYDQWAGLYQNGRQFIYVNRGIGTVGYPGRLGVWPEVTQFVLKRT